MFYDIIYILLHSYVNMSNEMVIEQYRSQYIKVVENKVTVKKRGVVIVYQ